MRGLKAWSTGLVLVAGLWFFGIAWPLSERYPHLIDWLKDRMISEQEPKFDRARLRAELMEAGFAPGDPVHIRIFKQERRLELWMQRDGGRYGLFKTYPICNYSGDLGPKLVEGDRQAPEGYYRIARSQLNPNSRHHLAFNLGFPNAFDRQLGRTGSALMVHGGCSSVGCYAIGDANVDEVYMLIEAALDGGQREVDVAAYPFEMTEARLAQFSGSEWDGFWRNLLVGSDLFVRDGVPPMVAACEGIYRFGADADDAACVPITGWA